LAFPGMLFHSGSGLFEVWDASKQLRDIFVVEFTLWFVDNGNIWLGKIYFEMWVTLQTLRDRLALHRVLYLIK
jgi:hypothetical protein